MAKIISASVNVALAEYDESLKKHVVELMKESLREKATEYILENTWEVVENKRTLSVNEDGLLETQDEETMAPEISDTRETLEVMTIGITVTVV
ncbi:hypothetical protein E4K67_17685 [Desulfosporosinus fructosivorans]|uniref:Uncharacterized protein n=1 Tax=Desulfosporosinus fructosivorans TaxID=2018669 RepID=A0A4Z0R367_9FIRM|nr:hypothetical protein [Desulfosporosinus fructosivorans]TGE36929.1 hypothetical protein E4K67_17685 [Desulfosporosinus fructosivorans]